MSINAWAKKQGEVYLSGSSALGTTLADLRAFVEKADELGIKDTTNVFVSGLTQSATYRDVYYFSNASLKGPVDDE